MINMKNEKEEILDFYKDIQKMTIKRACEREGQDLANISSGRASLDNLKKVKKSLEDDLIDIMAKWEIEAKCQIKK